MGQSKMKIFVNRGGWRRLHPRTKCQERVKHIARAEDVQYDSREEAMPSQKGVPSKQSPAQHLPVLLRGHREGPEALSQQRSGGRQRFLFPQPSTDGGYDIFGSWAGFLLPAWVSKRKKSADLVPWALTRSLKVSS